jgi:hypothetical protein
MKGVEMRRGEIEAANKKANRLAAAFFIAIVASLASIAINPLIGLLIGAPIVGFLGWRYARASGKAWRLLIRELEK